MTSASTTLPPHFDPVQYAYRRLRLQEKMALALIYRNPGMDLNNAIERLSDFYFSGQPIDALRRLMNTSPNLVDTSEHAELLITPQLHEAVAEILRREPPF